MTEMAAGAIDRLGIVVQGAGELVESVGADQWDSPTPCAEWTVRDLVEHLAAGNLRFAEALGAGPDRPAAPEPAAQPDPAGPAGPAGPVERYRRSSAALMDAFRRPGALEKTVTVPFGTVPGMVALHLRTTELLVHGWDLARATGRATPFPEDIAEQELAFSRSKLADIPPDRSPFAPPQPAAGDLPAIDRLAACLGRVVTSTQG